MHAEKQGVIGAILFADRPFGDGAICSLLRLTVRPFQRFRIRLPSGVAQLRVNQFARFGLVEFQLPRRRERQNFAFILLLFAQAFGFQLV